MAQGISSKAVVRARRHQAHPTSLPSGFIRLLSLTPLLSFAANLASPSLRKRKPSPSESAIAPRPKLHLPKVAARRKCPSRRNVSVKPRRGSKWRLVVQYRSITHLRPLHSLTAPFIFHRPFLQISNSAKVLLLIFQRMLGIMNPGLWS